ncbi:hypothetical protein NGA55_07050 [Lactococcus formosensis]|uniref:hypothetical protein n=1 Tax=Lactococcus formosensis TaxID=1281486 RepID=UPI000305ECD9|nr:hypothetical protein [Lactococcus formosensis]MDG6128724.1 hypothetical protein [Lactococcus formosensis]
MNKELLGYHGTDEEYLVLIRKEGFKKKFSKSSFPNDLGFGAYFFVDRTKGEAQNNSKRYVLKYKRKYETPIVLEVPLKVSEDNILDFNERENLELLEDFARVNNSQIKKELRKYNSHTRSFKRGNLDGIVIDLFIEYFKIPADVIVKDTFTKFDDEYKISNFTNGREVCVKNTNVINLDDIRIVERIDRNKKEALKCL